MHWLDDNLGFLAGTLLPFVALFECMHGVEVLYDKHRRSRLNFTDMPFFWLSGFIGICAAAVTVLIFWQVGDDHLEASFSIAYRHINALFQKTGLSPYWRPLASFISGVVWLIGAFVSCIQFFQFLKKRKRRNPA